MTPAAATHLHVTQLDARFVEGVGGVGSAKAHAHVHVVAAGGESGVEDWKGVENVGGGGGQRRGRGKPDDT